MMKKSSIIAVALLLALPFTTNADTNSSNTYYECGQGVYSDVPARMQVGRCKVISAKTGSTIQQNDAQIDAKPLSLAEQQAQLNNRIMEENKKNEEAAAKLAQETKAENCKVAQMNKDMVEKTNARNKADLLPKYEADIAKFCS